jgi:AraC-like DNA-binding protein
VSAPNVLRRAGLPGDLLTRPSVRLAARDFHRFWEGLDAECEDPLLPLRLNRVIRSEQFSPVLFAALCSPDLQVAAQRVARYKALVAPIRLDVEPHRSGLTIRLVWRDDLPPPPSSLVTTELLFIVTLARMGTREPITPARVTTTARLAPAAASHFTEYLGVTIRHGHAHEVEFHREDATRPFLTSNDALWSTFEPHLRRRLTEIDTPAPLADRVRAVLLEALPSGASEIGTIARRLAISPRSLQRQLEAEGASYRTILRDTRRALAEHYLRDTTMPPAEIALLLGFEEPHSFHRAFRAWTGRTPDGVRREATRP